MGAAVWRRRKAVECASLFRPTVDAHAAQRWGWASERAARASMLYKVRMGAVAIWRAAERGGRRFALPPYGGCLCPAGAGWASERAARASMSYNVRMVLRLGMLLLRVLRVLRVLRGGSCWPKIEVPRALANVLQPRSRPAQPRNDS